MCVCGAPWVIKMAIIKVISQDSRLFTRPSVFSFLTYVFAYIYIYISSSFEARKLLGYEK